MQDNLTGITQTDLLAVAKLFGIKRAERVLTEMREALARWEEFAAACAVPQGAMADVCTELDRRARELAG